MATYVRYNTDNTIAASATWPARDMVKVDFEVVRGYDGKLYRKGSEPEKPVEQALAEMQAEFTDAIQRRLDAFAQERGYDGIMSVCSYFGSSNPRFKAEADRAIALRDATWDAGYALLDEVLSGARPMPTLEEVFAELPALVWEEVE